jgi:ubiquinone/menaquinone biosynthesis C-methylase UbiE
MAEAVDLKTQMNQLIRGYWTTQAIFVAAELRIADLLADGPKGPQQLGLEAGVKGDMLYRVLRALASIGIFAEDTDGRFMLTPLAETLRGESGQRAYARLHGRELYQSWFKLLEAVRSGDAGFVEAYGMPAFEFFSKNPERGAVFDKAMTGHHGAEAEPMLDAYDFSGFKELVDVGGGNGGLLTAILRRHTQMNGVLFDLPTVVDRASAAVENSGLRERCRIVGGSALESVPAGADAYLMRHVLHDWRDEDAATMLRNCRNVMKPDGKVLVVEIVVPAGNDPSFAKWMDLMMVTYGGKERSEKQYRELFRQAGLELTRIVPTKAGISVIEGVRSAV